jgi:hypothetical protein
MKLINKLGNILACYIAIALLTLVVTCGHASMMVAHWRLDETNAPYRDSGLASNPLILDINTTTASADLGIAGAGTELFWQSVPGISTRLFGTNSTLQTDSFGFSFWVNPIYMNAWDNLIAKEMAYNSGVPTYSRIAWQVHLVADQGNGYAPLEFIVRGDNRANGDFYGNVISTVALPLTTNNPTGIWYHVAGGYDAATGGLRIFVNGTETDSGNGVAGAHNSDGSPFDVGTVKNGPDFVFFAANTIIDDVQIYNGSLESNDVAYLMANPGTPLGVPTVSQFTASDPNSNVTATFNSFYGQLYAADVSTNASNFLFATNVTASSTDYTTVTLPKSVIDGIFGSGTRQQLYLRIRLLTKTPDCN